MLQTVPVQPADEEFLYQVYAGTRRDEVFAWGWNEAQQEAFLRMQFLARSRSYQWAYPHADHRVILCDGCPVGQLLVNRAEQEIRLVDIALLPEYRGKGLGFALVRELQAEAAEAATPIRLQVDKGNPARALYERLGFAVTGENELTCVMAWHPQPDELR
ncbi:MAG TPA: GNAT family N-acetyltransferase [Symbiobacteriaceae bacterium]|nr:GNAT family N-acetyltransferase [Symbiobacteriaceae bacterium]